jgi:hypothetical protein
MTSKEMATSDLTLGENEEGVGILQRNSGGEYRYVFGKNGFAGPV